MKKYKTTILAVSTLLLLCPSIWAQNLMEVEGELSIDPSSGEINVHNNWVANVADPQLAQDAATKAYVDLLEAQIAALQSITQQVADIDNNAYKTVEIGTQTWMAENLRVTRYNDGTAIPQVIDNTDWSNLSTPAYTWYDNGASDYGALYNYFVVADTSSRNVCPTGWHVPSDAEWTILTTYLGGSSVARGKMKETGLAHWNAPNTGATNESGFAGLPGGLRSFNGTFSLVGNYGIWWSSTEFNAADAWSRALNYNDDGALRILNYKGSGYSVRCLRD